MSVFAVVGALKSAVSSMFNAKPALLSTQAVKVQEVEPRHVQLNQGAHPLLLEPQPAPQVISAHPGKALLQRLEGASAELKALPDSPLAQLFNRAPGFAGLAIVEQMVAAPPIAGLGGRVSDPQGPTFLPGGSVLPAQKIKEEYEVRPEVPVLAGRPEQRWIEVNEGRVPTQNALSDFIHLSSEKSEKDFFRWVNEAGKTGTTKKFLGEITAPDALAKQMEDEWRSAFSEMKPQGPHKLSGDVVRLNATTPDQRNYMYQPTVETLAGPVTLHADLPGFNAYGVFGTYFAPPVSGLKIEINSNFPKLEYLENYWGNADAMMKALLQSLEDDGIQPRRILVRTNELTDDLDRLMQINRSFMNWRQSSTDATKASLEQEMNHQLRNVGGMGVVLDKGYRVESIVLNPADGNLPRILLGRRDLFAR